jgi:hypothetical protein
VCVKQRTRNGIVGKVNSRRGRHKGSGNCCGSAAAAAGAYCRSVNEGAIKPCDPPQDAIDAQQTFVPRSTLGCGIGIKETIKKRR